MKGSLGINKPLLDLQHLLIFTTTTINKNCLTRVSNFYLGILKDNMEVYKSKDETNDPYPHT